MACNFHLARRKTEETRVTSISLVSPQKPVLLEDWPARAQITSGLINCQTKNTFFAGFAKLIRSTRRSHSSFAPQASVGLHLFEAKAQLSRDPYSIHDGTKGQQKNQKIVRIWSTAPHSGCDQIGPSRQSGRLATHFGPLSLLLRPRYGTEGYPPHKAKHSKALSTARVLSHGNRLTWVLQRWLPSRR